MPITVRICSHDSTVRVVVHFHRSFVRHLASHDRERAKCYSILRGRIVSEKTGFKTNSDEIVKI